MQMMVPSISTKQPIQIQFIRGFGLSAPRPEAAEIRPVGRPGVVLVVSQEEPDRDLVESIHRPDRRATPIGHRQLAHNHTLIRYLMIAHNRHYVLVGSLTQNEIIAWTRLPKMAKNLDTDLETP